MITHICDKCGKHYADKWQLMIIKRDGKIDLCPNCQKALREWLGIPEVVPVKKK